MIAVGVDASELQALARVRFPQFARHVPYATARALSGTATALRNDLVAEMREKFDRVTPWVVRGMLVEFATRENLTAAVYANANPVGAGTPAARVLKPHIVGGGRGQKRFEQRIGGYVVPGAGAALDRYGNLRGKELVQILSALGVASGPGHFADRTERSKSRNKKLRHFFRRGNVIYERLEGRRIMPMLVIIGSPDYQPRLDWRGRAQRVVRAVFAPQFVAGMDYAIKTAKR